MTVFCYEMACKVIVAWEILFSPVRPHECLQIKYIEHKRLLLLRIEILKLPCPLILEDLRLWRENTHLIDFSRIIVLLHCSSEKKKFVLINETAQVGVRTGRGTFGFKLLPSGIVHIVLDVF